MRLWSQPAISYISQPHFVANPSRETVPPETVRIMLAEDQPLLTDRLNSLGQEFPDLEVVGTATTSMAALEMAAELSPDAVLVREKLSDADGLSVCELIHRKLPDAAIIVVSDVRTDVAMLDVVEAGACGLISRLATDEDLVLAILRAAEGELLMPRSVVLRLFHLGHKLRLQASHQGSEP